MEELPHKLGHSITIHLKNGSAEHGVLYTSCNLMGTTLIAVYNKELKHHNKFILINSNDVSHITFEEPGVDYALSTSYIPDMDI